jgi:PBP1b-binding outer membrane lipoprotein LpoB
VRYKPFFKLSLPLANKNMSEDYTKVENEVEYQQIQLELSGSAFFAEYSISLSISVIKHKMILENTLVIDIKEI